MVFTRRSVLVSVSMVRLSPKRVTKRSSPSAKSSRIGSRKRAPPRTSTAGPIACLHSGGRHERSAAESQGFARRQESERVRRASERDPIHISRYEQRRTEVRVLQLAWQEGRLLSVL